MIYFASFKYDDQNYLAAGETEDYLAVFVEDTPKRYVRHGHTRWPSWSKFMQGGEVEEYREGSVSEFDELERRFGLIDPATKSDIFEHQDFSRFYDNPFQPPNASPELLEWFDKRDEAVRIWRETGDDSMAIEIGLFPSREEEEELRKEDEPGEKAG